VYLTKPLATTPSALTTPVVLVTVWLLAPSSKTVLALPSVPSLALNRVWRV
jgi:hypothetical protein